MKLDINQFTSDEITLIVRDLLSRTKIVFDPELNNPPNKALSKSPYQPDMFSFEYGKRTVKEIVDIKTNKRVNKRLINEIVKAVTGFYHLYFPQRFILIFTIEIKKDFINEVIQAFEREVAIEVEVLDLTWIEEAIQAYPDILEKYSKNTNQSAKWSSLLSNDIFLAEYKVGSEDLASKFLNENSWSSFGPNNRTEDIKKASVGDILILKTFKEESEFPEIEIKGLGVVLDSYPSIKLNVKWEPFDVKIQIPNEELFKDGFIQLPDHFKNKILQRISEANPSLARSIFDKILNFASAISSSSLPKGDSIVDTIKITIQNRLQSGSNFWFINDRSKWLNRNLIEGREFFIEIGDDFDIRKGELALCFDSDQQLLRGVAQFEEFRDETQKLKLIYLFKTPLILSRLKEFELLNTDKSKDLLLDEFHQISEDLFTNVLSLTELKIENVIENQVDINQSKIAKLTHDTISGEDYLGIDRDINAFSKIIASNSFVPPLAIALFGQWGTGKSFFMRKLWQRIELLSKSNDNAYNSGIVQIHFNAWSYMDANLWASIVGQIFENLNRYINNVDAVSTKNKKKIEDRLNSELKLLQEERDDYKNRIANYNRQIKGLEGEKKKSEKAIQKKLEKIRESSLEKFLITADKKFNVKERIEASLSNKENLSITIEELKKTLPERYWANPEIAFQEVKTTRSFIKYFLSKKYAIQNILILIGIVILITGVPYLLSQFEWFTSSNYLVIPEFIFVLIAAITSGWKRIEHVYNKFFPIINSFWQVSEDYKKAKEDATLKYSQHIESLKIEIEKIKNESTTIQSQIISLDNEVRSLNFKLDNFLSTQTMYSLIEKRATGDTYRKHLGIISTIRSDFEVLSELFIESDVEQKNAEFRDYFNKHLQRIVLYIDDLDRCPEKRVVEVLEAVNLIMAFPLFVVIVGVDPRWVKNALISEHRMQFIHSKLEDGIEPIDALNYLEKIFQIPFHLNEPEDKSIKIMIRELCSSKSLGRSKIHGDVEVEVGQDENDVFADGDGVVLKDNDGQTFKANQSTDSGHETKEADDEHLSLDQKEVDLIQEFSNIIGPNPRGIKRFVNIYHIVRAHEGLRISQKDDTDFLILMFLLAFPMGKFKEIYEGFVKVMDLSVSSGDHKTLGDYLKELNDSEPLIKRLDFVITKQSTLEPLKDIQLLEFHHRNQFIRRFTFSYST